MKLRLKKSTFSAGLPIAIINKSTAKHLGVIAGGKVDISLPHAREKKIAVTVDISKSLATKNEIVLSSEATKILDKKKISYVEVNLSKIPDSLKLIKKKLSNKSLTQKDITQIIEDIVNNSLSDPEIYLFVSAMNQYGMSMNETVSLIKAILKTGQKLNFKNRIVADKHSIGGIAGRTTPLVVSICASAGVTIPKTSSRAITSATGTADMIEIFAKVDLSAERIEKIVRKTNACIVGGGGIGLVPADSRIIKVEKSLNIDPEAQLLASIMSKKLAVGSDYILLDIPYGNTAKVDRKKATALKRKFERIGKYFHKEVECNLSLNKGPLGNGVGPVLEMMDVLSVLRREGPCHNLEKRSLEISGALLELSKKAKKGKGLEIAKEILDSGKALKKFKEIISAQGGKIRKISPAKFFFEAKSKVNGKIKEIDNKKINSLARVSGCPDLKCSGVLLHVHEGDRVKKGQETMTIYSESPERLSQAKNFYKKNNPLVFR